MKIILDTNFIISCVRQKIDLFNFENASWIIPLNVIEELKKISITKDKTIKDRRAALVSLEIIDSFKDKKIDFPTLKIENVDSAIIDFCKKNPRVILATLDRKIKSKTKNDNLTIRGRKFLKVEAKNEIRRAL